MIEKLTIGIVGNQYSNGGNQPLINIDSPFNLYSEYPFDTNVMSESYIEVKHMGEYISYVFNLRPSLVHSVGAIRDGVFWIALTIPAGVNVYDKDGNCVSPLNILGKVFSIFSENYMQKRGNGYEFKEGTCFRQPVDEYIDSLSLVSNPFITPVLMDSNGGVCYLAMDREKMGLFLKDTQYPELAQYRSVIVSELINSQSLFNSPIPRPLNISVKYRNAELGRIDYYSKQEFRCTAHPDNPDTHSSVEIHFAMSEFNDKKLVKTNFSAEIIKSPYGESYISVNPEFPAKSTFIPIFMEDSLWNDMYIENGKGDEIRASRPEGQSAYGFSLIGSQLRDVWKLHHKGKLSDIVWNFVINGNVGLPTNPTLVATNKISIAEKVKRSLSEPVKDVKSPTNKKSLNEPVDILSYNDIRRNVLEKDRDAKLILSYGGGDNKIIVQKVIAYEIALGTWKLGAPFNPYLEGYQLEIKSKKFDFTAKKSTDGSALFTIDGSKGKEPFYKHVLDTVKKHSNIVLGSLAVLAVLLAAFACYKNWEPISETWHKIFPPESQASNEPNDTPGNQESAEITMKDIRGYVSNLKYHDNDLSFADLKELLSKLQPVDTQDSVEVQCLKNILDEINMIKEGRFYNEKKWEDYAMPDGIKENNTLRKNILTLYSRQKNQNYYKNYEELNNALKPLYLMNDWPNDPKKYDQFQKKYIKLNCGQELEDLERFKKIATFSGILQLYEAFIKG